MSLNIAKSNKKRVVIVGGGFGGLKLANKLKKSGFQVVLRSEERRVGKECRSRWSPYH